jgi:hypothetical protein
MIGSEALYCNKRNGTADGGGARGPSSDATAHPASLPITTPAAGRRASEAPAPRGRMLFPPRGHHPVCVRSRACRVLCSVATHRRGLCGAPQHAAHNTSLPLAFRRPDSMSDIVCRHGSEGASWHEMKRMTYMKVRAPTPRQPGG